jgi:tripeptidyl-peptidase-1
MFVLKTLSVTVAVAIFAVSHPTSHLDFEKSVAETLKAAPAGWVQDSSEEVDKDATSITLKIHLVNKDMDKFHERAMNVSAHSSRRDVGLLLTCCTGRDTWSSFLRPAHVA